MSDIIFTCTVEDFALIPKRRCPNKTKYRKGSPEQKYLANKEALAWEFKSKFKGKTITGSLSLSCGIHLSHRRIVDLDNLTGTIKDALQDAGVIENDHQIKEFDKINMYQGKINRVCVTLKRLEEL